MQRAGSSAREGNFAKNYCKSSAFVGAKGGRAVHGQIRPLV